MIITDISWDNKEKLLSQNLKWFSVELFLMNLKVGIKAYINYNRFIYFEVLNMNKS